MKIQKQKSDYKRGYHKYVLVLPNELVKKAGFKGRQKIRGEAKKGEIKLKKAGKRK